jgi:1,4-dihydroxy-2-naphthoate octaprenyltransferase
MSISPADVRDAAAPDVTWQARVWLSAFRLQFLPQGVLPVALGSAVAWLERRGFHPGYFALALVGAACVQVGLTMLNDALDYVYGADRVVSASKNPYSGGSGVLADGHLQPRTMLAAVTALYLAATGIGAYLTLRAGAGVFLMALLGLFLSVFYSVKPLRLAYRGLGEVALLIGYGPTISLGAAYVQTGSFSLAAGLAGLVPGMLMTAMILVNEIPDYREDLRANKRNLTVRLGPARVSRLYAASLALVYAAIVAGIALRAFPALTALGLGSLPLALRSIAVARRHYLHPRRMAPANRAMVFTYSATMVLFTLGFVLTGLP